MSCLNRDGLKDIRDRIYVMGHKCPDSDSVLSAMACADWLRRLGSDAVAAVLGPVNRETAYILGAAGLTPPELLRSAAGKNVVLVDHSEYAQSAEGLRDARVLGVVDHHKGGNVAAGDALIYDVRLLGATATIVWSLYGACGLEPDRAMATALAGAILSDTRYLRSATTTPRDREALRALSRLAGIDDPTAFYREMRGASLSYEGMTDEEIFFGDYKEYECAGLKFAVSCLSARDDACAGELIGRVRAAMPSAMASAGLDIAFVKISVHRDDASAAYLLGSDGAAAEALRAAFGDEVACDGEVLRLGTDISRKQVLVPALLEVLRPRATP